MDGLDHSQARWNILAQQVLMAEVDLRPGPGRPGTATPGTATPPTGPGCCASSSGAGPPNPVVLSGDIHSFLVNDLKLNNRLEHGPVLATEFVGTSITSGTGKYGAFARHLPENPKIRFFESRLRGYTRCMLQPERWYTDLRVVDSITHRDAGVGTLARFLVEDGRPGAHRVH